MAYHRLCSSAYETNGTNGMGIRELGSERSLLTYLTARIEGRYRHDQETVNGFLRVSTSGNAVYLLNTLSYET